MAQLLEQITPWRLADTALDRLQVEQGLPGANSVDDVPERLPHPLRPLAIVPRLPDIQSGQHAQLRDDPIRLRRRIRQDLVQDQLRIRHRLPDQPFEMT
jgi:hypothetical protein